MCRMFALADGRKLWQHVRRAGFAGWGRGARSGGSAGLSAVGAVVGATFPARGRRGPGAAARARCSCCRGSAPQGGSTGDVAAAFAAGRASALISASRSVIYAYKGRGRRLAVPPPGAVGRTPRAARFLECLRPVDRAHVTGGPGAATDARRRYAAPVLFLIAVTIAVLLIRSGLGGGATLADDDQERPPWTHPSTAATPPPGTTRQGATTTTSGQFYTVGAGDTFRLDLREDRCANLLRSSS